MKFGGLIRCFVPSASLRDEARTMAVCRNGVREKLPLSMIFFFLSKLDCNFFNIQSSSDN